MMKGAGDRADTRNDHTQIQQATSLTLFDLLFLPFLLSLTFWLSSFCPSARSLALPLEEHLQRGGENVSHLNRFCYVSAVIGKVYEMKVKITDRGGFGIAVEFTGPVKLY